MTINVRATVSRNKIYSKKTKSWIDKASAPYYSEEQNLQLEYNQVGRYDTNIKRAAVTEHNPLQENKIHIKKASIHKDKNFHGTKTQEAEDTNIKSSLNKIQCKKIKST